MNKIGKILLIVSIVFIAFGAIFLLSGGIMDSILNRTSEEERAIIDKAKPLVNNYIREKYDFDYTITKIDKKYSSGGPFDSYLSDLFFFLKANNKDFIVRVEVDGGSVIVNGDNHQTDEIISDYINKLQKLFDNKVITIKSDLNNPYGYKYQSYNYDYYNKTDIEKFIVDKDTAGDSFGIYLNNYTVDDTTKTKVEGLFEHNEISIKVYNFKSKKAYDKVMNYKGTPDSNFDRSFSLYLKDQITYNKNYKHNTFDIKEDDIVVVEHNIDLNKYYSTNSKIEKIDTDIKNSIDNKDGKIIYGFINTECDYFLEMVYVKTSLIDKYFNKKYNNPAKDIYLKNYTNEEEYLDGFNFSIGTKVGDYVYFPATAFSTGCSGEKPVHHDNIRFVVVYKKSSY